MALPRKGARNIVVGGTACRWRLRHKPSYAQSLCLTPCNFAVELAGAPGPLTW